MHFHVPQVGEIIGYRPRRPERPKYTHCPCMSSCVSSLVFNFKWPMHFMKLNLILCSRINYNSVHLPPHLDPTKSELAFEERMLPKLNRECKSENKLDTQRALKSLTDIVHSPEVRFRIITSDSLLNRSILISWHLFIKKIAETIQTGLFDTVGELLKSDDDMCRNLASEIFSVMTTHNIGRTAGIKFIPHLASLFKGRSCTQALPKTSLTVRKQRLIIILDSNSSTRVNVHKTLFCLADIFSGNSAIVQNKLTPTLISLLETEEDIVKIWIVRTLCKNMRFDNRKLW